MAISDFFVAYWWLMAAIIIGTIFGFFVLLRRSADVPLRGRPDLASSCRSSAASSKRRTIARWTRTLATMFAAGVPLVESLDAVARRVGQRGVRRRHRKDPDRGQHRHEPHQRDAEHGLFPSHGAADDADRRGVRLARRACCPRSPTSTSAKSTTPSTALSSLLEPIIIVFLGVVDRRPGGRDVPADLQARLGRLTRRAVARMPATLPDPAGGGVSSAAHRSACASAVSSTSSSTGCRRCSSARLAGAVRGAARRNRRPDAAALQPDRAALAVPRLRAPRSRRAREHPRRQLLAPARALLGVRRADLGPLSRSSSS